MEVRILGPLQVVQAERAVTIGGPRERALLTALALRSGAAVSADALVDAVWGGRPPRSAAKQLQNHVLRLRKALGPSAIETRDGGYALAVPPEAVDARRFEDLVHEARVAVADGDADGAGVRFGEALALWRGMPGTELDAWAPAAAEITRLCELHRLVEEEAIDARLARGEHAACVADLEVLVAAEPLREHRWAQLMIALYRSGRQGDALRAFQRARATLADELGVEPGPELRAVEQAVIAHDDIAAPAATEARRLPTGVVTFLLTDIEGSTQLWEAHPDAMAAALGRHDELVNAAVADAGGVLLKSRGEGDSTFSVFARSSDAIAAALAGRGALVDEPWPDGAELSVRFALHAGEAVERDGDFYGPAVNRAARLRAIGSGGQILVSQTVADLVRDGLPESADLVELGPHALRGLERPERVFALVEPGRAGRDSAEAVSPYPGLRAFQAEDRERFFGREALVDALVARVGEGRLLAVVGASGSGKSSLVRAGLMPRLAGSYRVILMTPGVHPLADPAARVLRAEDDEETSTVVIIDQVEELFTRCADDERRSFFDHIVSAVGADDSRVGVVLALRGDFYGRCAEHPGVAQLVEEATALLGPLHPEELRAAIEGPAHVTGLRIEPGLVDLVLADVADEPGALPLLSHALLETWRRRRGRALTVSGYRESGGVRGAIARTAESVYGSLAPERQATARDIFLRLTELGEGSDETSRRVALSELMSPDRGTDVAAVVDILADARLVTVGGGGTVEVAHEALIREWPRLRTWLDDDRVGLRMLGRLRDAARDWSGLGRDPGALYRGARLAAMLEWLSGAPDTRLTTLEREFVDASVAAQEEELRAARAATRRLRVLVTGLGVAFVIALLAGALAIVQRRHADRAAASATRSATLADVARLAALARTLPARQTDLALLLGIEARRLSPSALTDGGLQAALTRTPIGLERVLRFGTTAEVPAATDDGRLIAAPGVDGKVRLYDVRSGRLIRTFAGHDAGGAFVAQFNHDATMLMSGGNDGKVIIWRVASGAPIGPAIVPGGRSVYGYFDPSDAGRLVTVASDGRIARWDVRDPSHPRQVGAAFVIPAPAATDTIVSTMSPDGRLLAAGAFTAQHTVVWDVASHRVRYELPGAAGRFSPDGALLTTTTTRSIRVWSAATGAPHGSIGGFNLVGPAPVFSADGRRLAAGDLGDETVRVVDVANGRPIGAPLMLHRAFPFAVAFLPGNRLVTVGADEAAVWRLGARLPPLETVLQHGSGVVTAQFAGGVAGVATLGPGGVRVWDPVSGALRVRMRLAGFDPWYPPAFSPDGKYVAAGGRDGAFTLWDRASGRQLSRTPTGAPGWVSLAWDPRRSVLVADSAPVEPGPTAQRSSLSLWNVSDPARPARAALAVGALRVGFPTFAFSADGRRVAIATGSGGGLTVIDVTTGRPLHVFGTSFAFPQAAFSPDGRTLATVTGEGTGGGFAILFDTTTWKARATVRLPYLPDGIAFVGHGTRFVTTSFAGNDASPEVRTRVDLWDTETRQPVGEPFAVPTSEAFLASADAQGKEVAVGATNGLATVIAVDPSAWERAACEIAGRNLTRAEWTEYLPGRPYRATCPGWPVG